MEITYIVQNEIKEVNYGRGCYTQCYINSDCGSDYRC